MTADRLTAIEVKLLSEANPLIRRYQAGQFAKSLVSKLTQFGEVAASSTRTRSPTSTRWARLPRTS